VKRVCLARIFHSPSAAIAHLTPSPGLALLTDLDVFQMRLLPSSPSLRQTGRCPCQMKNRSFQGPRRSSPARPCPFFFAGLDFICLKMGLICANYRSSKEFLHIPQINIWTFSIRPYNELLCLWQKAQPLRLPGSFITIEYVEPCFSGLTEEVSRRIFVLNGFQVYSTKGVGK